MSAAGAAPTVVELTRLTLAAMRPRLTALMSTAGVAGVVFGAYDALSQLSFTHRPSWLVSSFFPNVAAQTWRGPHSAASQPAATQLAIVIVGILVLVVSTGAVIVCAARPPRPALLALRECYQSSIRRLPRLGIVAAFGLLLLLFQAIVVGAQARVAENLPPSDWYFPFLIEKAADVAIGYPALILAFAFVAVLVETPRDSDAVTFAGRIITAQNGLRLWVTLIFLVAADAIVSGVGDLVSRSVFITTSSLLLYEVVGMVASSLWSAFQLVFVTQWFARSLEFVERAPRARGVRASIVGSDAQD